MNQIVIGVKTNDDQLMPFYASALAAGADIKANLKEPLTIELLSSIHLEQLMPITKARLVLF